MIWEYWDLGAFSVSVQIPEVLLRFASALSVGGVYVWPGKRRER